MANPEHVAKLKEGVEAWNQWRNETLEDNHRTNADLREADLSGAHLSGMPLRTYDVQQFTDSREKLGSALGHDVSHQSAHKPDRKPPQREIAETPKQEKSQGMDIGLSL